MSCAAHAEHPLHGPSKKIDWLLWISGISIAVAYLVHWQFAGVVGEVSWLHELTHSVFELMNTIWWGVAIGILMIAILGRAPREFVMSALGTKTGRGGIVRATLAGVLLDLCSVEKRRIFARVRHVLVPDGQLYVADYGLQRTKLMRTLFRRTVQAIDGIEDTAPNVDGMLLDCMQEAGFDHIEELQVIPTLTGSISIYRAENLITGGVNASI